MFNLSTIVLSSLWVCSGGLLAQSALAAQLSYGLASTASDGEALVIASQADAQSSHNLPDLPLEVEDILAPQQLKSFRSTLDRGEGLHAAVASMELSSEQITQLQDLMQTHDLTLSQVAVWVESERRPSVPEPSSMGALLVLGLFTVGSFIVCHRSQKNSAPNSGL